MEIIRVRLNTEIQKIFLLLCEPSRFSFVFAVCCWERGARKNEKGVDQPLRPSCYTYLAFSVCSSHDVLARLNIYKHNVGT